MGSMTGYAVAGVVVCTGFGVLGYQLFGGSGSELPVSPSDTALRGTPAGPGGAGPEAAAEQMAADFGGGEEDIEIPPGGTAGDASASDSGEPGPPRRRVVATNTAPPEPIEWMEELPEIAATDYSFRPAAEFSEGSSEVARVIDRSPELSSMPVARRTNLHSIWSTLVGPLITGDEAAFIEAAAVFGAVGAEGSSNPPGKGLYDILSKVVVESDIDLSAARIRKAPADNPRLAPVLPKGLDIPAGAAPLMVSTNTNSDGDGNETSTTSLGIPLAAVFPLERDPQSLVEIWAPARVPGSTGEANRADIGLSIFFAFDGSGWKPTGIRVVGVSDDANELIRSATTRGGAG